MQCTHGLERRARRNTDPGFYADPAFQKANQYMAYPKLERLTGDLLSEVAWGCAGAVAVLSPAEEAVAVPLLLGWKLLASGFRAAPSILREESPLRHMI